MGWDRYEYREYVPVAEKMSLGRKYADSVAKKQGRKPTPVTISGRKIATTFWGQAWCENLEAYSDYSNRLPRGATYVRNGSVVDLVIKSRRIEAIVAGSDPYVVTIDICSLDKATWKTIKQDCTTEIDSLLDLLSGKFSDGVMQRLTRQKGGLFPAPREIKMTCSCPDGSYCCKHLAAVMYGVGSRLDNQPELLFLLRDIDPQELVSLAASDGTLQNELAQSPGTLEDQDLGALFGIELDQVPAKPKRRTRSPAPASAATTAQVTSPLPAERKPGASTSKKPAARKRVTAEPPVVAPVVAPVEVKRNGTRTTKTKPADFKKVTSKKSAGVEPTVTKATVTKTSVTKTSVTKTATAKLISVKVRSKKPQTGVEVVVSTAASKPNGRRPRS